jgi:hypothetical protein
LFKYLSVDDNMSIKNTTDKKKFSQLRHSLRRLSDEARQLINPFFSDKPLIKGSVYELKTKFGKPGCKCAKGEFHHHMVGGASEKGKTKLRGILYGFLVAVQTKVRRYQNLTEFEYGLSRCTRRYIKSWMRWRR